MNPINLNEVKEFVNKNIMTFHESRIQRLEKMKLHGVLKKKNPYLFRAKNIMDAEELIKDLLDAYLSSSEEKIFGDFLEELAIFVAEKTCNGIKSSAQGMDLEFERDRVRYIVSIKSGTNWGNSSQIRKLEQDFRQAEIILKQSNRTLNVQSVLGISYGRVRTSYDYRGFIWKLVGQNFWYFISGNENIYSDIIEPLGYKAGEFNERFYEKKIQIINKFTEQFLDEFCDNGIINWKKIVEFNSGNLDIDLEEL
ncbi:Type II restriction endonuclease EcoO109I [Orenia metallireducens]|uniref:Type II restriction endonuclease EcoO109I n=1 Tax=Orenia metallireducens TaxID=1413210 RepID=A0A285GTE6_9FIRM|nr:PmeII family type II restriction endonuclease [Orenia metallireducens]SNY26819.1 Type II restriction endonuclease EcoO109I [Orenia metallireducens]